MRVATIPIFLFCGASLGTVPGQNLTARQLFYLETPPAKPAETKKPQVVAAVPKKAPAKKPVTPGSVVTPERPPSVEAPERIPVVTASYGGGAVKALGLRYSLMKVTEGGETEVSADTPFRSGDMVRLRVEGNRTGFLYVISRGSSGNWKPLFPSADIDGGQNRITGRRGYAIPSGKHAFTFDDQAGDEQLFVVFSEKPVDDLDELIYSLRKPESSGPRLLAQNVRPIGDGLVSGFRAMYARDLLIQKVDPKAAAGEPVVVAAKQENAVYVVSSSGGRVVADIRLVHR